MGAQKFMGAQKLLRGHDASASLRHPQMAPARIHGCCGSFMSNTLHCLPYIATSLVRWEPCEVLWSTCRQYVCLLAYLRNRVPQTLRNFWTCMLYNNNNNNNKSNNNATTLQFRAFARHSASWPAGHMIVGHFDFNFFSFLPRGSLLPGVKNNNNKYSKLASTHLLPVCHRDSWYMAWDGHWAHARDWRGVLPLSRKTPGRESAFLFQRLSMALQRGNAVSFRNIMVTE